MKSISDTKRAMRMELRTLRRGFVQAGGLPEIALPALFQRRIDPGVVIASYLPSRYEADPRAMVAQAAALGARIALPHIAARSGPMRFLAWQNSDPLEAGVMGIDQPLPDAPELAPDIIFAPLIGFDDALHRLGQGGGFYDRAFARFDRALRVGVAWSIQEVPAVPTESWDAPLDAVITERGLFSRETPV